MDVPQKVLGVKIMAIKQKSEIMEQVKAIVGENTDDATLTFLEDLRDTIDDLETKSKGDGKDWKAKYEENDKMWRNKYQQTFFNPPTKGEPKDEPENDLTKPEQLDEDDKDENEPLHFEDLFSNGTGKE